LLDTADAEHLRQFCQRVRERSEEHAAGMRALSNSPGLQASILRQELDSLVRVIYLLSQSDQRYCSSLLADAAAGLRWRRNGKHGFVSDAEMVRLADTLGGWEEYVYRFGCGFIHLSDFHDDRNRDPLKKLSADDRVAITGYIANYHHPRGPVESSADLIPLLPAIFAKIASNLEHYTSVLESGDGLDRRP
jgi:hypothetical protein